MLQQRVEIHKLAQMGMPMNPQHVDPINVFQTQHMLNCNPPIQDPQNQYRPIYQHNPQIHNPNPFHINPSQIQYCPNVQQMEQAQMLNQPGYGLHHPNVLQQMEQAQMLEQELQMFGLNLNMLTPMDRQMLGLPNLQNHAPMQIPQQSAGSVHGRIQEERVERVTSSRFFVDPNDI